MKHTILLSLSLLAFTGKASCQYFFQDIYNTRQTIANMALLKNNKVKTQVVQSLDASMNTENDFRCERAMSPTYHQMRAKTQSRATGYSVMTSSFSSKGWLTKTTDSTEASVTTTLYRYDAEGHLLYVSSTSQARDSKMRFDESRSYSYDNAGKVTQMVQKKGNDNDSVLVRFKTDSIGHVTEELETRKGVRSKRTFYNYDAQGHLTDIFRYHPTKKRMLPDYIFEYDAQQRLSKMTTVNAETSTYSIWSYNYLPSGLPQKEECYGKGNELLGTVKYSYTFNP
ncbi:hypothetical protein [Chitinophaga nivalis]|uniref:YD repeat-containing protein n=1 Tax=Chitinophaga nivalis TaxID=2991709 RepID=A0ABT3IQ32_9BACT|nr:hypothetical protein [Chitinophaga nivalis]MCW3464247.1 hypothetical protein [Chitinophaga nivalis]MCW3486062.1 hypothetical protein [Chitinophaga nivalis]